MFTGFSVISSGTITLSHAIIIVEVVATAAVRISTCVYICVRYTSMEIRLVTAGGAKDKVVRI